MMAVYSLDRSSTPAVKGSSQDRFSQSIHKAQDAWTFCLLLRDFTLPTAFLRPARRRSRARAACAFRQHPPHPPPATPTPPTVPAPEWPLHRLPRPAPAVPGMHRCTTRRASPSRRRRIWPAGGRTSRGATRKARNKVRSLAACCLHVSDEKGLSLGALHPVLFCSVLFCFALCYASCAAAGVPSLSTTH